ncbi:hypothetical protein FACS189459_2550 [Bacilli bacterium]|nr:hypothetical protein FACS189459_2550 [Bacilli bacterium]
MEFIIAAYGATITKEELNEMLDLFQIKSFYKNNASSLSGGQSQRLNILLALMHKPKVVFLDELSTGLDITTRNSIKVFIKNYTKKHGMTVVLVSHDVSEIIYLCDRILVYREGTIVSDRMIKEFNNDVPKLEEFISNMIKNKPEKID